MNANVNSIHPDRLFRFFSDGPWFGDALQPFFEEYSGHIETSSTTPWPWADRAAVVACLDGAWSMLGKWQARRAHAVSWDQFVDRVPGNIIRLAEVVNRHNVTCLRDLSTADDAVIASVCRALFQTVYEISLIKPNKAVSPMFGSKVVHHYFPTLVPVFDGAKIRDGVMQTALFKRFAISASPWRGRVRRAGRSEPPMVDFQDYFACCADQIEAAGFEPLERCREILATRCEPCAPQALRRRGAPILYRMDAKVAEFCLAGRAAEEGFLGRNTEDATWDE